MSECLSGFLGARRSGFPFFSSIPSIILPAFYGDGSYSALPRDWNAHISLTLFHFFHFFFIFHFSPLQSAVYTCMVSIFP
jgi:hypothetical protein